MKEFPAVHPIMGLYAELMNGRGKVPFTVRLVDANEEFDSLCEITGEIDFPDPRMVIQLTLPIGQNHGDTRNRWRSSSIRFHEIV